MISDKTCDAVSVETLRACLDYRPADGALIWKFRSDRRKHWNRRYAGRRAGSLHASGYRRLGINGQTFREQRIVWAIVHGAWPDGLVDHRDGNTANNRIDNLRIATLPQNSWNRAALRRCKTGSKGVRRVVETGRFHASIMTLGVRRNLGSYATLEDATAAYAAAATILQGEFARGAGGPETATAVEIIRPAHPQQRRASERLSQISELHAAGHRTGAIVRFTNLSRPTVKRHLALIRAGAQIRGAEGVRVHLVSEARR